MLRDRLRSAVVVAVAYLSNAEPPPAPPPAEVPRPSDAVARRHLEARIAATEKRLAHIDAALAAKEALRSRVRTELSDLRWQLDGLPPF